MGLTYFISWIASGSRLRHVGSILVLAVLGVGLCHAEQLRGILYFDELGNGRFPSGTTKLAVGTKIYTLQYGDPHQRHFRSEVCYELGAVWSFTVATFDGSPYVRSATCSGEVDDNVHGPWLLVRNYLARLPGSVSSGGFLSGRWHSSLQHQQFVAQLASRELQVSFNPALAARCIDVLSVEPVRRTRLAVTCSVELQGKAVFLVFDVVRNSREGNWEINQISIEDPQEYWRIKGQRSK